MRLELFACLVFELAASLTLARYLHTDAPAEDTELVSLIKQTKLVLSSNTTSARAAPCLEVSDKKAKVERAIVRSTMELVDVHDDSPFHVSFCAYEGSQCAVKSSCSTIYKWRKLRTSSDLEEAQEILLPAGCFCVLPGLMSQPIIFE
ncbi:hypothetical protein AAVH_22394 [Aphelenchoides avenae]|nr:hypothetical protein AAVH_22394 [Aphelenchus avenae]